MLLSDKENKAADEFAMEHYEIHKKTARVVLTAKQTGLGYSITVQCPHCRKKRDITDTSDW